MTLLYTLDLLGTAAFAASGALAGTRRGMDIFGVLLLGLVTATGGGTVRDLLLGDVPPSSSRMKPTSISPLPFPCWSLSFISNWTCCSIR